MTDLETVKAEVRKLSSLAVQAKMNLHDLAEDLPINWEQIPLVAQHAHGTYRELEAKRAILKAAGAYSRTSRATSTRFLQPPRSWPNLALILHVQRARSASDDATERRG